MRMNCDKCKKPITGKVMIISPVNGIGKVYHAHAKDCAQYLLDMLNTPNNPHKMADKLKSKEVKKEDKPLDLEAIVLDLQRRVKALENKR